MRNIINLCERYLVELNGIKTSDELSALKNMDAAFSRDGAASSVGQSRHMAMCRYMQVLKDRGFEPLGAGGYGCVFTHPGIDYAIKIFEADPAYMTFVKYALANQDNPHLPIFRGRFMKLHNDWYAVRIGLLTRLPDDQRESVGDALYAVGDAGLYPEDVEQYEHLFATYPRLKEAMEGVVRVCREASARIDVSGSGNIMGRHGVPVLSDPVAPRR